MDNQSLLEAEKSPSFELSPEAEAGAGRSLGSAGSYVSHGSVIDDENNAKEQKSEVTTKTEDTRSEEEKRDKSTPPNNDPELNVIGRFGTAIGKCGMNISHKFNCLITGDHTRQIEPIPTDDGEEKSEKTEWTKIGKRNRFFHRSVETGPRVDEKEMNQDSDSEDNSGLVRKMSKYQLRHRDSSKSKLFYEVDKVKDKVPDAINSEELKLMTYFEPEINEKKPGRRIAFFDGKLKRVSNIQTVEETFHVVFHYYLTWLMSKKEVIAFKKAKKEENFCEWEPKSRPIFECANLIEGETKKVECFRMKEGTSFKCLQGQCPLYFENGYDKSSFDIDPEDLGFDPRFAYWCRVQYECRFTCAEEMELEMFPFDCQDLAIHMRLKQKANEWDVLPLPRHGEIFNVNAKYSMVSEWKIPGVLLEFEQGDPKSAKNKIGYNSVIIRVKAERKWEAHMADSITIFCMYWLGLATFGMPVEEVGDRLAYCITLLLTDVATMQLLNENIPNIPYRTFLDMYTYGCFLFLCCITAWVSIAGWHGTDKLSHHSDFRAFILYFVIAFALHIFFFFYIKYGNSIERSKLKMDSEGLESLFDSIAHSGSTSSMPQSGVYWDSRSIKTEDEKVTRWAALSYPWPGQDEEPSHLPKFLCYSICLIIFTGIVVALYYSVRYFF